MNRASTAVIACAFVMVIFSSIAIGAAFRMPELSPAIALRAYFVILLLVVVASGMAALLPLTVLRRERQALQELTRSVATHKPRLFTGELSELSQHTSRLIEARNKLAEQNREIMTEAERGERLAVVGQFAAGLAHEIRNPITNVIGFAALARERCGDENLREDLRVIEEEARRCESITDSILAFSRTPKLSYETVDIAEVFSPPGDQRTISESGRIAEGTPRVEGDRTLLRRVAENIFRNAREAGAKRISVSTERVGKNLVIRIADDGPGIPVPILATLFDPFTTHRTGGLGLGLALSKGIVAAHGGTIKARNRSEGGAEFEIVLPVTRQQHPTQPEGAPRPLAL